VPNRWRAFVPDGLALAGLALAALIFYWPLSLGLGWIPRGGGDLVSFLWPTYSYAAQSLRAGRVPLWNPSLYSGAPFAADNQSGVFYPINLIFFLLWPGLPYTAVEWLVVLHVWLAGAGMYLMMRALLPPAKTITPRMAPALFAAAAYMFSDVFVTHVGNLNIVAVSAWLPFAFAALHLAFSRASAGWAAVAGVILGVAALAGHAQMTLIVAAALGLYALWHAAWRLAERPAASSPAGHRLRRALGPLALAAVAFVVALGLSALATLPAAQVAAYTGRARLDYAAAAEYSLPWSGLAGLFSPLVFGRGAAAFWGPWARVELGYAGALTLFLAALAPWKRAGGLTLFLAGLALFGLLVALGQNTPLHYLLYRLVPGFAQLRVPARFILLTDFGLAALAGFGLARLGDMPRPRVVITGLAVLALGVLIVLAAFVSAPGHETHAASLLFGLGTMSGLLLTGLALALAAPRPAALAGLLALAAIDLIGQGAWVEVERNDPTLGYNHPAVLAFLRAQAGPARIEGAAGAWAPDAAARLGLEDIGGIYNPLSLAAYQTYVGAVGARGTPLYNFLSAQFVLADKGRPPGDSSLVPVLDADPALDVYLNTNAQPRIHLVYQSRIVDGGAAAFGAIHAPGFDPADSVVLDASGVSPAPVALDDTGAQTSGERNLFYTVYSPEGFAVVAQTPASAYLVFSEVWYPGWRAWIDGVEVPVYQADLAFRAVFLPTAGQHTVTMRFEPLTWKLGLSITLATVVLLAGWTTAGAARQRCR
jgi:hypothetical protein